MRFGVTASSVGSGGGGGGGGPATALLETSGPTTLDIAAILDGELLQRIGATVGGAQWQLWGALWALNGSTMLASYRIASMYNWGPGDTEVFFETAVPPDYSAFVVCNPVWSGSPTVALIQPPSTTSFGVVVRDLAGVAVDSAFMAVAVIARTSP